MKNIYYFDYLKHNDYKLVVVVGDKGLCFVDFIKHNNEWGYFKKWLKSPHQTITLKQNSSKTNIYIKALNNYFQNITPLNNFKFDLRGTPFQIKVWQTLLTIKPGQIITYQDLATLLNKPQATRAVANAVARNPIVLFIPCHRVVSKNNDVKYRAGPDIKLKLINLEKKWG